MKKCEADWVAGVLGSVREVGWGLESGCGRGGEGGGEVERKSTRAVEEAGLR